MRGIECLGAPDSRGNEESTSLAPADPGFDFSGRSVFCASTEGTWIAVSGGAAPVEVLGTRVDSRVSLAADSAECDRLAFSPNGTYLVTWQRPSPEKFPDGSLRVWVSATGALAKCFHAKLLNKGGIAKTLAWSGDEKVAMHAVTNTLQMHSGDCDQKIGSINCPGVTLFAASPAKTAPYHAALFVGESKGKPATVKIFAFPALDAADQGLVVSKSFYRAQDVDMKWSPTGLGVLVQTHTDVDATGSSYYGGTGLYLLHANLKNGEPFECLVPLPKEGPIADAAWAPNGREFVVVAGAIPPAACLYNAEATPIFNFGAAHRNTISWSPHGRFLALAGFGNLAGDVDFWDRHKKKKLGSRNMSCTVEYGWSPDSRQFMVATTAPRMNVDNGLKIYRYDGSGPVATMNDRAPLWDAKWLPDSCEQYPDRGVSPGRKQHKGAEDVAETTRAKAYVPPGARRGGSSSLADAIRADREKSMGGAGKAKTAAVPTGIPGMAAAPAESRNKKRKDAAKKRADADAAAEALDKAKTTTPVAAAESAVLGEAELTKKRKALLKKVKAVRELKAKVDSGDVAPSAEQKEKLDRAGALDAELSEIDALLAKL